MPIINLKKIIQNLSDKILKSLIAVLAAVIVFVTSAYSSFDASSAIGVSVFVFGVFFLGYMLLNILAPDVLEQYNKLLVIEIVLLINIILAVSVLASNGLSLYFIPVPSAAIMLTVLYSPEVALISAIMLSLFTAAICGISIDVFFVSILGSFAAIYSSRYVRNRKDLNRAGLYVFAGNVLAICAVGLMKESLSIQLVKDIGWGTGNALVSVVIASGLLPIFESLFSITTNIHLLELADFNQPLLKRLMLEAPGTYHHSLMVGNLVENACESIGANALLARVGAYYHDVGKLSNPQYFIENQVYAIDKHKNLKPNISALILKRHVKDGFTLAEEYKLDDVIKDIVVQHHGTTLMEYFYHKVLKEAKDKDEVDEKEYRYPGPRPHTKEAGALMLADSVEAACRALDDPTYSRISGLVTKVINNKFIDNQLNSCNITLADLEQLQQSFIKTMSAIHHSRIEYPEDKEENNNEQ